MVGTFIVASGGASLLIGPASGQEPNETPAAEATQGREVESVRRGDLSETKESTASIAYGDGWDAPFDAQGTVTRRHEVNRVVSSGEPLIWLNTNPVILARGDLPMYRTLSLAGTKVEHHLKGDDIQQLQNFLLEQGHPDKGRLTEDGIFGASTKRAVVEWQKANGLKGSGSVDRSQIMFHPEPVRIASSPQLGSGFTSLRISEAKQKITASFDRKSQQFLPVGGKVQLDVAGQAVDATIEKVESVVNDQGESSLSASLSVGNPVPEGMTRVKASVSRKTATDALLIPVRAIVALAGGGYAVEVDTASGAELRRVELGAIADDLVEIAGDIVEGESVVVPVDPIAGSSS